MAKTPSEPRPTDLPEFTAPPLTEVVLGVQFSELRGYRTVHGGLLWNSQYRPNFPFFEERPPLRPVFETFGAEAATESNLDIEIMQKPEVPRLVFSNEDGDEIIQVQPDRFLHNWRKVNDDAEYPHYEYIRNVFKNNLLQFQSFLHSENLGEIEPNQIELTYINYILHKGSESAAEFFSHVFRSFTDHDLNAFQTNDLRCEAEDIRFGQRYALRDHNASTSWGRLHVHARPAQTTEGRPAIRLDLTARGQPEPGSVSGVLCRLDAARKAIVAVFTSITTPEMHKRWGRTA